MNEWMDEWMWMRLELRGSGLDQREIVGSLQHVDCNRSHTMDEIT